THPRGTGVDIPLIERVKIQAEVLIPRAKALRADLGEERANAIVRQALGGMYRRFGEEWCAPSQGSSGLRGSVGSFFEKFAAGAALDYTVVKQAPEAFEVDVTGCRYARFYQALGVPELGFLLTCCAAFPMADGFGANVKLTRTQ